MLQLLRLCVLVAFLWSTVAGQAHPDVAVTRDGLPDHLVDVKRELFSTIGICSGSACSTPSSSIESDPISSTSIVLRSRTTSRPSSTSTTTTSTLPPTLTSTFSPSAGDQSQARLILALTTTFTPPPACATGITQIYSWGTDLVQNAIDPDVNSAYTSCLPSQFYSSVLATATLPPFEGLICPYHWENYNLTSTYLVCCPNGYELSAPQYLNNTQRPGQDAMCYSLVGAQELLDITSYDSTGGSTIVPTSLGDDNGTVVFAYAFDGFIGTGITEPAATISAASTSASTAPHFATASTSSNSIPGPTASSKPSSSSASSFLRSAVQAIFFIHIKTNSLRIVLALGLSLVFVD